MAEIRPFKGLIYNQNLIAIEKVISPPYDVISKEMQDELYELDPYNIVRLILGKENLDDTDVTNKYSRAAETLSDWQQRDVLVRHEVESIYVYGFEYRMDGVDKQVLGFISLVRLADFSSGVVLPHEKTFEGPKADRLKLMKATSANLEQIFSIYSEDSDNVSSILSKASEGEPLISVNDKNGVVHKIWQLNNGEAISRLTDLLSDKSLFIADGHHRYETAINYASWRASRESEEPGDSCNYIPMLLVDIENEPLDLLPTHRIISDLGISEDKLLSRLSEIFEVRKAPTVDHLMSLLKASNDYHSFGLYLGKDRLFLLTLTNNDLKDRYLPSDQSNEWRSLDAAVLQYIVLEGILGITVKKGEKSPRVSFTDDHLEAVALIDDKRSEAAFLMKATKIDQVKAVANNKEKMPQKSTYFYPKPLTGLVLNLID